ncbi:MAG: adenylate kinase [Saprospiraceae bacterium]|jgi:adenylate kinase|nr:adenylate kinase [Saprospiraceae bacterium]
MINLILFGPPGSGKGTQAAFIANKYNLLHISTGDLFRYELSNNTELGQRARAYMDQGMLVPDSLTIEMLKNKVLSHPDTDGYIFDGFPRTIPQAEALDTMLAEMNQSISALVALEVPDEEIVERILLRGQSSLRADDLNEEIIRKRISVYQAETSPVFEYYSLQNKSHSVSGLGTIEEITQRLSNLLDNML